MVETAGARSSQAARAARATHGPLIARRTEVPGTIKAQGSGYRPWPGPSR